MTTVETPSRSPAEYFIKYLISHGDTDDICNILVRYNIPPVDPLYIASLVAEMEDRPEPWNPSKTDNLSAAYLKKHGIYDIWFPEDHIKEAFSILGSAQIRADVEQLLLSPLNIDTVVSRINKHHSIQLTVPGIQSFGHYFWNRRLLPMHKWIDIMEARSWNTNQSVVLRASPDVAPTLVPWVMGYSGPPKELDTGTVARRVRDVAYLKVLEIEKYPASLAQSKMMKNYSDVIKNMENELRQSDVALRDVIKAFEKFRMHRDDSKVPSIEDVAGFNYSRSGEGTDRGNVLEDEWKIKDEDE